MLNLSVFKPIFPCVKYALRSATKDYFVTSTYGFKYEQVNCFLDSITFFFSISFQNPHGEKSFDKNGLIILLPKSDCQNVDHFNSLSFSTFSLKSKFVIKISQ